MEYILILEGGPSFHTQDIFIDGIWHPMGSYSQLLSCMYSWGGSRVDYV